MASNKTPGVYINEVNAFPSSVIPVATAVPAFIGYTPQASYEGKSLSNQAIKISSLADFKAYYCLPDSPTKPVRQYHPEYYLVQQSAQPASGNYLNINGSYYSLLPDPSTIYYLYNSVQLFYQNGGKEAYIVSIGTYGAPSGKPMALGAPLINPNVQLSDLQRGLALLQKEQEPTMYICPEATLLSLAENGTLMQSMVLQSSSLQTSISIFDIIGGNAPDPTLYVNDIANFRNNTGINGLNYGVAYYPFISTEVMQSSDVDYTNLFGGDVAQLAPIINPPSNPDPSVTAILANIQNPQSGLTVAQNNSALLAASQNYKAIMQTILGTVNILPPSGAMAGVITTVDYKEGVWRAPANVDITGASTVTINLNDDQQANLNVDAVSGKSINAIRNFPAMGVVVWGARTLDGNSLDWRYVNVRRTMIFIERSCKLAAQAYMFEPNVAGTWMAITTMLSNFLTDQWKEGAFVGATPAEAFLVSCGLGSTMTGEDILNGFMNVTIMVAVQRPAEFIEITFQQQMAAPN